MPRGYGFIFQDEARKAQMLAYRLEGYSYAELAKYYGVKHTAIIYHCRKAGLPFVPAKEEAAIAEKVREGQTVQSLAQSYGVAAAVIVAHCVRAGISGFRVPRIDKKLVLELPHVHERRKRAAPRVPRPPAAKEERKGWIRDGDEWICAGKSFGDIAKEAERRKKEERQRRWLDNLNYPSWSGNSGKR